MQSNFWIVIIVVAFFLQEIKTWKKKCCLQLYAYWNCEGLNLTIQEYGLKEGSQIERIKIGTEFRVISTNTEIFQNILNKIMISRLFLWKWKDKFSSIRYGHGMWLRWVKTYNLWTGTLWESPFKLKFMTTSQPSYKSKHINT